MLDVVFLANNAFTNGGSLLLRKKGNIFFMLEKEMTKYALIAK